MRDCPKGCAMADRFRVIDFAAWSREEHYRFFREYGLPFFSITCPVDVLPLRQALRERQVSFTVGLLYVIARAANAVPQFRQRIREEAPVEHELVHPGVTVLAAGDTFRFALCRYDEAFAPFSREASRAIETARTAASLVPDADDDLLDRDDLLYCTALPWIHFTGFFHPLRLDPSDSVPRIAWGRFEERGTRLVMPLNIQAHHALIDGVHVARFVEHVEQLIRDIDSVL